jgi:hypothetical protein
LAKLTLNDIVSGYAVVSTYNTNNTAVEVAIENTLSRDGTAPNAMDAVIDMSSHQINNLADGALSTDAVNLRQLQGQVAAPAGAIPSQTGHAGKHLKTDGTTTSWNDVATTFMDTVLAAVTAAEARSLLGAGEIINVKDSAYGAVGDGVANDTTALIAAINAANTADTGTSAATLVLPDGVYLVTPASLPTINCNVAGPGAMIKSASSADTAIITFDDLAYGRKFDIYAIVGPNFGTTWQTSTNQHGIGLSVLRSEHSRFYIQKLEGLFSALSLDGNINEDHIGECRFVLGSVLHNNYGVNLNAGDVQCEANRFEIAYFNNNLVNVLMRNHGSAGTSLCANNHFDILVMEFPTAGGVGFDLGGDVPAQTLANTFIVRENISPNATATVLTGAASLGCNYFRFSDFDFTKINTSTAQIFDGSEEHNHPGDTAFKSRSQIWGAAAPSASNTYWQVGSICRNNAPTIGGNSGWLCSVAGSPGTWVPFGIINLQGSVSWDPGSIAAGAREQKDITVTGAALGDFAIGSFSSDLLSLDISAHVNSTNLVSVMLYNNTGSAINLAAGTVYAKVIKK